MSPGGKRRSVIGATLFAAVALTLVDCINYKKFYQQAKTTQYKQATGVITKSDRVFKSVRKHGGGGWSCSIEYQFEAEGMKYTSRRLRYAGGAIPYTEHLKMFPTNKVVDVFYNPADPADSVLLAGLSDRDWRDFKILTLINLLFWPAALWLTKRARAN